MADKTASAAKRLALIMGVANKKSIAWACVNRFLRGGFDCILTVQNERFLPKIENQAENTDRTGGEGSILEYVVCDVKKDIPNLFTNIQERVDGRQIDAIVHSVAYANFEKTTLSGASWDAYSEAQHISSYSLLETAREAVQSDSLSENASLSTLSFLGAVRASQDYHIMGPAKASLEALVRGLAYEYGSKLRVNAVSAGPINTLAARGIPNFRDLQHGIAEDSPLRRNVTTDEVASTVHFLATEGTGITGQIIYVDAGYNSILPTCQR